MVSNFSPYLSIPIFLSLFRFHLILYPATRGREEDQEGDKRRKERERDGQEERESDKREEGQE